LLFEHITVFVHDAQEMVELLWITCSAMALNHRRLAAAGGRQAAVDDTACTRGTDAICTRA